MFQILQFLRDHYLLIFFIIFEISPRIDKILNFSHLPIYGGIFFKCTVSTLNSSNFFQLSIKDGISFKESEMYRFFKCPQLLKDGEIYYSGVSSRERVSKWWHFPSSSGNYLKFSQQFKDNDLRFFKFPIDLGRTDILDLKIVIFSKLLQSPIF